MGSVGGSEWRRRQVKEEEEKGLLWCILIIGVLMF